MLFYFILFQFNSSSIITSLSKPLKATAAAINPDYALLHTAFPSATAAVAVRRSGVSVLGKPS